MIENKNVYNLIEKETFNRDGIYYSWMENCSFFIIAFNKEKSIAKTKMTLDSLIKKHFNNELQIVDEKFYESFNKVKKELLNESILVFQYCDAL